MGLEYRLGIERPCLLELSSFTMSRRASKIKARRTDHASVIFETGAGALRVARILAALLTIRFVAQPALELKRELRWS